MTSTISKLRARARARVSRSWVTISEPRDVTAWAMITYGLIVGIGAVIWLAAPMAMDHLDVGVRILISVMLIGGGSLGVPTAWIGIWRLERLAPVATGFGLVATGLVLADLHINDPTPPPTLTVTLLLVGVACAALATRAARLRQVAQGERPAPGPLSPECEEAIRAALRVSSSTH